MKKAMKIKKKSKADLEYEKKFASAALKIYGINYQSQK